MIAKLTRTQLAALHGLRQHEPHAIPPARFPQYHEGELYAARAINSALSGLARRSPALCFSFTENGARRFQLSPEGSRILRELEESENLSAKEG
jgi:hypothetical protein